MIGDENKAAEAWADDMDNVRKHKAWMRPSHIDAFLAGVAWSDKKWTELCKLATPSDDYKPTKENEPPTKSQRCSKCGFLNSRGCAVCAQSDNAVSEPWEEKLSAFGGMTGVEFGKKYGGPALFGVLQRMYDFPEHVAANDTSSKPVAETQELRHADDVYAGDERYRLAEEGRQEFMKKVKPICAAPSTRGGRVAPEESRLPAGGNPASIESAQDECTCEKMTAGFCPPCRARSVRSIELKEAVCACGHAKLQHIYEVGACRPGFVCGAECTEYLPSAQNQQVQAKEKK